MLGSPPSNYFGVSMDRFRNYIPPHYNLQSPKIIPPSLSPARTTALLPPLSPRASSRFPLNSSSPGRDVMASGITRRRSDADFTSRHFSSKTNSMESPSPSWSSMTSFKNHSESPISAPSSLTPSSPSSSSSSLPKQPSSSPLSPFPLPPYQNRAVFPGLSSNPMASALALKMGMFTPSQNALNDTNDIAKPSGEEVTKHSPKMLASFTKPHPYLIPFGPRILPTSSNSKSSSSSPSISSTSSTAKSPPSASSSSTSASFHPTLDFPNPPALLSYPKIFTSFLTPEEQQQQYMAMLNIHQQASASSSKDSPTPHGLKASPATAFATRNYLELAMLVCNTFRGKLFPCPHCRYVTDRRNNLKRHVATMHQACDKQLECCGVTFATKASLREHIAIFHHNGYSCTFCGRRFCRKALLKRHLSVHNGQKDYTCPSCDYATSHKSNLERHKRIHARLPENGESPMFPDTSLDDDATTDDVDFKNRDILQMPSSSTNDFSSAGIGLPYYYDRLYKSFSRPDSSLFSSSKENGNISCVSMHNAFLQNPFFFKEKIRSSSKFSESDHVTDPLVTSTLNIEDEGDEDQGDENSDSDIDIDSVDDNENNVLESSMEVKEDEKAPTTTLSKTPKTVEESDDDNRPLNLVKVRNEKD